jgi:HEAT repeat protein
MRIAIVSLAGTVFVFGSGFMVGYFYSDSPAGGLSVGQNYCAAPDKTKSVRELLRPGARGSDNEHPDGIVEDSIFVGFNENYDLFISLQAARDAGDLDAVGEALIDILETKQPLAPLEIETLGALFGLVESEDAELIARALVQKGGALGIELIIAYAADETMPLDQRRNAIEFIAESPMELTEDLLTSIALLLDRKNPTSLQLTAAETIGSLAGDQAFETLYELLQSEPGISADIIFDTIGALGLEADINALVDIYYSTSDPVIQMGVVRAVSDIAVRERTDTVLTELLQNEGNRTSRGIIVNAIADSSEWMSMDTMLQALELTAGDASAQESIGVALARLGREGVDVLIDAMNDQFIALDQQTVAYVLSEYEGVDRVPIMLDLLSRMEDSVALEALANELVRTGDDSAVESLLILFQSEPEQRRIAIASALPNARHDNLPLARLSDLLLSEDQPAVIEELARSANELYGTDGHQAVTAIFNAAEDSERRRAILWGLEDTWERDPELASTTYLQFAAWADDADVRLSAIEILLKQEDPSFIPDLEKLYQGEADTEVRELLAEGIEELESSY